MKKLMTLAALVAACAPAFTAEVTSSNTVGYTKVNLTTGLNLLGAQFVDIGGQTSDVNKLVSSEGLSGYDDVSWTPSNELRIWNGHGYATYGWTGDLRQDSPNLASEMGVTDDSLDNCWLDEEYAEADDPLAAGTGLWIKASRAGTVIFSGEVPSGSSFTTSLVAGINLVSYPWPKDFQLSKISVSGQSGYDDEMWAPTTEIRVWNGRGYTTYGWTGNLRQDSPSLASEMGVTDDSLDNCWLDEAYTVYEESIEAGTGFWIKASASGSVTFVP